MEKKIKDVTSLFPLFRYYISLDGNSCGGSLHIWTDDDNVDDEHLEYCLEYALGKQDYLGAYLAQQGLLMTKTQRLKVAHSYDEIHSLNY